MRFEQHLLEMGEILQLDAGPTIDKVTLKKFKKKHKGDADAFIATIMPKWKLSTNDKFRIKAAFKEIV